MDDLANATGRHIDIRRQLACADAHRFHEFLQQDFPGVNFSKQFVHRSSLMVVHNFDLIRTIRLPDEAHPPLVVDADAVLTLPFPLERLQLIARRDPQTLEQTDRMQLQ